MKHPAALILLWLLVGGRAFAGEPKPATSAERASKPDIFFAATPHRVVEEMLKIARVTRDDVVYDLGSGDGRIVIAAARSRGARGVGIEIDPELVAAARANAAKAGVADRVEFFQQDLFKTSLKSADVIALYLLDSLNVRLRPKILAECRPGTRVVSYAFAMGAWEPDEHIDIATNGASGWIVPANISGVWKSADTRPANGLAALAIRQQFQKIAGTAESHGESRTIQQGRLTGENFVLVIDGGGNAKQLTVSGRIAGDMIEAMIRDGSAEAPWKAKREPGTKREVEQSESAASE